MLVIGGKGVESRLVCQSGLSFACLVYGHDLAGCDSLNRKDFVTVRLLSLFISIDRLLSRHQTNPTNPVMAHPAPNCTNNRLRSLLFRIPSLKPVTNGTSAFAFQNPVMCMYAAETAARLANASTSVMLGLKNAVTELMSERNIYIKSDCIFLLN